MEPTHTILICANAYQAGWLQTHDARVALESHGAISLGPGTGMWAFPNGNIVRFVSVYGDIQNTLRYAAYATMVVLLYESGDVDEDIDWCIHAQLEALQRRQQLRIVHFEELSQHQQRTWSARGVCKESTSALALEMPIDRVKTMPLDHLMGVETLV